MQIVQHNTYLLDESNPRVFANSRNLHKKTQPHYRYRFSNGSLLIKVKSNTTLWINHMKTIEQILNRHTALTHAYLPTLAIAEFFSYNLARFNTQTSTYLVCKIYMWSSCEDLNVGHFRDFWKRTCTLHSCLV